MLRPWSIPVTTVASSRFHDPITLKEAVALGLAGYSTIRKYIADGRLERERVDGRTYRISRSALEALRAPDAVEYGVEALPQSIRDWARARAAEAPPLNAEQSRIVVAMFTKTAAQERGVAAPRAGRPHSVSGCTAERTEVGAGG